MSGFVREDGLFVHQRPPLVTEQYQFVTCDTTEREFTQESELDVGGGNMEPDIRRSFELDITNKFPSGAVLHAAYVDFSLVSANDNSGSANVMERQTAAVADYDKEFPWYVQKKVGGTWTKAGLFRSSVVGAAASGVRIFGVTFSGHLDVKAEVDSGTTYSFRLGSTGDSEGWRALGSNLFLLGLRFSIRLEYV